VYAVRASNGTRIWATGLGGGPSTYATMAGGVVYFGGNDNRLYAVRG
jgi:outer membrane protein assembly factor BamB